jgi:hypothetical protein
VPPGSSAIDVAENFAEQLRREGRRRVDMTPAVANGTVFIGAGDHRFYAIDAATGKKKWSYEAGGGMASLSGPYPIPAAVLKDGTTYFVTEGGLHAVEALTGERKWLVKTLVGHGDHRHHGAGQGKGACVFRDVFFIDPRCNAVRGRCGRRAGEVDGRRGASMGHAADSDRR